MPPRLERAAARALRALPDAWVARLAGEPVVIRGRRLDPRLALLARAAAARPALHTQTPAEARRASDRAIAASAGPGLPLERVEAQRVPGAAGALPALLHVPPGLDGPRPLLLWFHQGGGVIGSPEWARAFCSVLARGARAPVLAVGYRKAPEHPFPAACEDAWAVYRWARAHADQLGGDPARIGVGGDSAGGGLAAGVAQRARAEGLPQPALQLLVYPWLVAFAENDAYRDFGDVPPLTVASLAWFLDHLLRDPAQRDDARLSPGLAEELAGLAPALVYTAGFDLLSDEGEAYARRLEAAGVPVVFRCYASLTHSFTALGGVCPAAERAQREIARDVDLLLSRG